MKKEAILILLLISVILVIGISGCTQKGTQSGSGCDIQCKSVGYSEGQCLRGGSALASMNPCSKGKGVDITNSENPISGCDFQSIGSWDVCCCYNLISSETKSNSIQLPSNFTLNLFDDGTSSGADRGYYASMIFEDGKLISATRSTSIQGGSPEELPEQCAESINVQTMAWENTKCLNWGDNCTACNFISIYLTKEEVANAINSKKIFSRSEGCHYQTCYDILT